MNQDKIHKLSAIVPINNYFQHKENIQRIVKHSAVMEVELILILDRESNEAYEDLKTVLKSQIGYGYVVMNNSGNPGGARNVGLEQATGEWITFWDCDDEPNVAETLKMILEAKKVDYQVLVGSYRVKNSEAEVSIVRTLREKNWQIVIGLNPGLWRFVFKRDFVAGIRFPEARMGEDQIFLQRVFAKNPEVLLTQIVTYVYRKNVLNQLTSLQSNLVSLDKVSKIAIQEFNPDSKYTLISKSMIIRQLLTLSKNKSSGFLKQIHYLFRATVLLIRNPNILLTLLRFTIRSKWMN